MAVLMTDKFHKLRTNNSQQTVGTSILCHSFMIRKHFFRFEFVLNALQVMVLEIYQFYRPIRDPLFKTPF